MKYSRTAFFMVMAFFSTAMLSAETIYVVSPAAKLLKEPKMNAAKVNLKLQKGQPLQSLGAEGLFYKVKGPGTTAYVARMYVSPFPPQKNTVNLANLQKNSNVTVTKGASAYSETASARGLNTGEGSADLAINAKYDEKDVKWIESVKVRDAEIKNFMRAGRLNNL